MPSGSDGSHSQDSLELAQPVTPVTQDMLNLWLAPFDSTTADSLLAGDFAPIRPGGEWVYYQSVRYPDDSAGTHLVERISQVTRRIVQIRNLKVGREIAVRTTETPIRGRARATLDGKAWEWENAYDSSRQRVSTRHYLERRGGFLMDDEFGSWHVASVRSAWLFHRVRKAGLVAASDPYGPAKAFVATQLQTTVEYVDGIGMVSSRTNDSTPGSAPQLTTLILIAKDGKVFNDSLRAALSRPALPLDTSLQRMLLGGLSDSLPAGFCTDAFVPGPDSLDARLADSYDLVSGTTWDYLYTKTTNQSAGGWMGGSGTTVVQGLLGINLGAVIQVGNCTLFELREFLYTDFVDSSYSYVQGDAKRDSAGPMADQASVIQGVKRGKHFYLLDRASGQTQLLARPPGVFANKPGDNLPFWIFPFTGDRPAGDTLSGEGDVLSLETPKCAPYIALLDSNPDKQDSCAQMPLWQGHYDYRVSSRFGLAYFGDVSFFPGGVINSSNAVSLDLFRYDGEVIDPAVFARYVKGP